MSSCFKINQKLLDLVNIINFRKFILYLYLSNLTEKKRGKDKNKIRKNSVSTCKKKMGTAQAKMSFFWFLYIMYLKKWNF